jgi:hypothetical protein
MKSRRQLLGTWEPFAWRQKKTKKTCVEMEGGRTSRMQTLVSSPAHKTKWEIHCENHTEHTNALCGHFSSYLTGITLRLRYRAQPVNAVYCENHTERVRHFKKIEGF